MCGPRGGNRCTCNAVTMHVYDYLKQLCIVYHDGNM